MIPTINENFEHPIGIPMWQSVSGDCFVPWREECVLNWGTISIWVRLIVF